MDKTAAIRSQARRAALTKAAEAQFTPEEQAFAAGFCKAAEVAGVDPAALYKAADDNSFGNVAGEFLGHTGGNVALLSLLGGLVGRGPGAMAGAAAGAIGVPLGALAALFTSRRSAADQKAWDSNSHFMRNMLLPGSASYNLWKRIGRIIGGSSETKAAAAAEPKASSKPAAKSPRSDVVHGIGNSRLERMGTVTAPAVATLLGSLLGGRGAARRLAGGVAGLGTGLLGNLGGSGLAYVTPTRSGEAQLKHDSVLHVLKNLLLPGVGTYNRAKRLEREQVHKWYN